MSLPRGNLSLFIGSFLCRSQGSLPLAKTPGKEATCGERFELQKPGVPRGLRMGVTVETVGGELAIRIFLWARGTCAVDEACGRLACSLLSWVAIDLPGADAALGLSLSPCHLQRWTALIFLLHSGLRTT